MLMFGTFNTGGTRESNTEQRSRSWVCLIDEWECILLPYIRPTEVLLKSLRRNHQTVLIMSINVHRIIQQFSRIPMSWQLSYVPSFPLALFASRI